MSRRSLAVILLASLILTWSTLSAAQETKPAVPTITPQATTSSLAKLKQIAAQLKKENKEVAPTAGTTAASQTTTPPLTQANMSETAFAGLVSRRLPLTSKQIALLYKAFIDARQAAAAPPGVPPRPVLSSILVNLSPDSKLAPPIIRLSAGYITTLNFVDATGQAWPIQYYSIGDPAAFLIPANTINIKGGDNILPIQAKTFYKRSNLVVHLRGLDTPIILTLLTGQKAVDYRVDLHIPAIGPDAILQRDGLPSQANPMLLNVLNGLKPNPKAHTLKISGDSNSKAWLLNNKVFLRTRLTIISPAWQAVMSSPDGTNAYMLQPASIILALHQGHETQIKLLLQNLKD